MRTFLRRIIVLRRARRSIKKATELALQSVSTTIKRVWQKRISSLSAGIIKIDQFLKLVKSYLIPIWKKTILFFIYSPYSYSFVFTVIMLAIYIALDRIVFIDQVTFAIYIALDQAVSIDQITFIDFFQSNVSKNDGTVIQNFVEWTGIPFGLIMSMVILKSWEKLESTGDILAKEASTVFDLHKSIKTSQLPESMNAKRIKLLELLQKYIAHVTDEYENEHTDEDKKNSGDLLLINVLEVTTTMLATSLETSKWNDQVKQLLSYRSNRLLVAKDRMPFSIKFLLGISSFFWLFLLALVNFENKWLAYGLFASLTFITSTMVSISFFFYELTSIKQNDTLNSWKELKNKTLKTTEHSVIK